MEATYISIPVTVLDSDGKVLPNLEREEFELFDEGKIRPIENFILDNTPIRVVLLLDVSGSAQQELEEIKKAGVKVTYPEKEQFRAMVQPMYDEFKKDEEMKKTIEAIQAVK